MGPSRDLYDLVKSLSKGETQRVTVDLKRTKSTTSFSLFRAYVDAKTFDEKRIKTLFPRTFFKAKERLRDRILDVLADSSSPENALQIIQVHINRITVWRSKGLFLAAERSITKAIDQAMGIERFGKVLELLAMKRELWSDYLPVRFREAAFDEFITFRTEIEAKGRQVRTLESLLDQLLRAYGLSPDKQKALVEIVSAHALLSDSAVFHSVNAEILHHRIMLNLARLQRDLDGLLFWTNQAIGVFEAHSLLLADPRVAWQYCTLAYMGGMFAVAANDFQLAEQGIIRLRTILADPAGLEFQTANLQRLWTLEVSIAKKTLDEKRALLAEKEISKGLKLYGGNLNPSLTISLYHALAEVLFYFGHLESAARWVRKLMQIDELTYKPVLVLYSRIFFLIIHLELEDLQSLESGFRSIEYFLKKHNALTPFEKTVIRFVKDQIKTPEKRNRRAQFEALASDLELLFTKPENQQRKDCFAILPWVQSKLHSVPLISILDEEFGTP